MPDLSEARLNVQDYSDVKDTDEPSENYEEYFSTIPGETLYVLAVFKMDCFTTRFGL
uniref:Uncharacterized protein n=1 Tax=Amphimedon queenslandica TaxID=400682 RepID=A0A1X7U1W4_AMPQE